MSFEELIRKYRTNSLNLDELEEMRRQLTVAPLSDIERAMAAVSKEDDDNRPVEVSQEMIDRVKNRLDREIEVCLNEGAASFTERSDDTGKSRHKFGWKVFSMVAMVLALVSVGVSFYFVSREKQLLASTGFTEVSTQFGEKSKIRLPDGTVVNMYGRTRLRYPSDISLGNRNVEFNGEAYFDVSKDADHPFTIRANDITVKVTGTSFNLYARHDSEADEIILDKGSVTLYDADSDASVNLKGGESAVFDKESGTFDVVDFKDNPLLRRRIFGIRYDNIQPEALIRSMEKTYGVSLNNEITTAINSPFTGVLPDDDINEALVILSKIYGFKIPYNKDKP
jgi:putative anti-sigma factor